MKSLPKTVQPYQRTPTFSADTVPRGLLSAHNTKAGTWAVIHVLEGKLLYRIGEPVEEEVVLSSTVKGVIEPEMRHAVAPLGEVSFHVEFYREEAASPL